jgi:hypothetical protein
MLASRVSIADVCACRVSVRYRSHLSLSHLSPPPRFRSDKVERDRHAPLNIAMQIAAVDALANDRAMPTCGTTRVWGSGVGESIFNCAARLWVDARVPIHGRHAGTPRVPRERSLPIGGCGIGIWIQAPGGRGRNLQCARERRGARSDNER